MDGSTAGKKGAGEGRMSPKGSTRGQFNPGQPAGATGAKKATRLRRGGRNGGVRDLLFYHRKGPPAGGKPPG